jgi:hypothetical protein
MFEKLDPSNTECEVSQVEAEERIDANKGIEVSHTITDEDLINSLMNLGSESKTLENEFSDKLSQRKFLGLKLLMHVLCF